jgi:hypothetical protein
MKVSVRRLNLDRQAEFDELLAALTEAETSSPDDPATSSRPSGMATRLPATG